jgi:hypothetical protein
MTNRILSIAAALAALVGVTAPSSETKAAPTPTEPMRAPQPNGVTSNVEPNVFLTAGEDLLAMVVTRQSDGTVVAAHYSHQSHASHASHHSHHSHYSSR